MSAVSMSTPTVRRLASGLTVVCQENRGSQVVTLQVWVKAGSADEEEVRGEVGLAHFLEHMLFKGTARHGVGEIAGVIEGAGGEINAWTSFDNTVYYVVITRPHLATALDVLADAVRSPALAADELEREREVICEEIRRAADIPARQLSNEVFCTAFQRHPYRRPVLGTRSSVQAATRAQIEHFFETRYRPERMVFVAVGDFDTEETMRAIDDAFGPRRGDPVAVPARPQEDRQTELRVRILETRTKESYLSCAWHIPPVGHEHIPALDVLSVLLGHGESSRLSRALKFKRPLANEAFAYAYTPRDGGLLIAGATLNHERILAVAGGLVECCIRLGHDAIAPRELEKAKAIIESEAIYQRETAQGIARKLGYFQTMMGDLEEEERYYAAVRDVRADDVRQMVKRYLTRENLTCVALLPEGSAPANIGVELEEAMARATRGRHLPTLPLADRNGIVRTELASGARLLVVPDRRVPVLAIRAVWLAGQRVEASENAGVGHLTARMLTRGTRTRNAMEIAHAVDAMASSLDGFSGRNSIGLQGDFLTRFTDRACELLADCARFPAFREDDFERERAQALELLRSREDDLPGLAFQLFSRVLYPSHPYRLDPVGSVASVAGLTAGDLRTYHERFTRPDDAVIAVGGDVEIERALALVEEMFGDRDGEVPSRPAAPWPDPVPTGRRVVRLVRERSQAHVFVGFPGVTFANPDRYALEVLANVLAGQSGRLFLELRDRQSLAYSVSAFSVEGLEPGCFALYMGTSPDKLQRGLAALEAQLQALRSEPPTEEELKRSRCFLIGSHAIGLQRVGARTSVVAFNELYGLGYDAHLSYAARIEAVTRDHLLRLAQQQLAPERTVVAIVAPEDVPVDEGAEVVESVENL